MERNFVPADAVLVDGSGASTTTGPAVLREQEVLADQQLFAVAIVLGTKHFRRLIGLSKIDSRGFVYLSEQ
ncbi:MAG: hypothetical protein R2856_31965 [Caldilineaceae bacterium]